MKPELPDNHPIIDALRRGDVRAVRDLLDQGVDPYAGGLISGAIGSGSVEIVDAFLHHGYDVDTQFNDFGQTPLYRAIEKGKIEVVHFLLRRGANPNASDCAMGTPLMFASSHFPPAVPLLLASGADPNAKNGKGITAVHNATLTNQVDSLDHLYSAGADLNSRDNDGTTPLIVAARRGNDKAADWLVNHGANVHVKDERGKSALDWAKANGHTKVVDLLQQWMGS